MVGGCMIKKCNYNNIEKFARGVTEKNFYKKYFKTPIRHLFILCIFLLFWRILFDELID